MKKALLVSLVSAGVLLTGCETSASKGATVREPTYQDARDNQFIPANQAAAKRLMADLHKHVPPPGLLIIASLVDVDDLNRSSTFGRIVSEQVSAEFTKARYNMRELKLRNSVAINDAGEMLLSRDIRELATVYGAQAVVVGSYATSKDFIYVNLKVVQPETNRVLGVHDYALPMDANNRRMLRGSR